MFQDGSMGELPFNPKEDCTPIHTYTHTHICLALERTLEMTIFCAASFQLQVSLGRKIKTFANKMVLTSGNDEDRGGQEKESKEESVLAMLGIIGTILNLVVIIFVYIYTTL